MVKKIIKQRWMPTWGGVENGEKEDDNGARSVHPTALGLHHCEGLRVDADTAAAGLPYIYGHVQVNQDVMRAHAVMINQVIE